MGVAVGLHRDGFARLRVAARLARRVPQSRVEPARVARRAGAYPQRPARPRERPHAVDPPARVPADVGGRGGEALGRSDLVVLPVLAPEIPGRPLRDQAGPGGAPAHRRVRRRRRRLGRRRVALERPDPARLDRESGTQDRDARDGAAHRADGAGAAGGEHVDCRPDRQRRRGGAPGVVCQHLYAGERYVPARGGGLGGGDRRVRRRHRRLGVPARHGPGPPGERQRLHAHLRGVRAGLRHGVGDHPRARAAARARSLGRRGAGVKGDTSAAAGLSPGIATDADPGRKPGVSLAAARSWLARLGPALVLALVVLVFALLTDAPARYLSAFNLRIVLSQTVIVALGAIGMTIIIVSGGIDLSVAALVVSSGWPTSLALLAAVLAGGLVGLANGLLITRLRVVPFIATLGMLGIARGVAKWLAHEQTVNVPPTWLNDLLVTFPQPAWMVLSAGVWITLLLALAAATVLRRTVFGRRVFALGSNERAARACGIATDRLKLWIYGVGGLLFGLAGVMQLSRLRQGDPTVAIGTELDVIAAVVIGGGSLSGGEGSIFGSVVGALIMAFLRNGCQQMGWPNYIQEIIIGGIIVLAVALDRLRAGWAQ